MAGTLRLPVRDRHEEEVEVDGDARVPELDSDDPPTSMECMV